jgi:hypothetical protein
MNSTEFTRLLEQLSNNDWQRIIGGDSLLIVNDLHLETGPAQAPNAVLRAPEQGQTDGGRLKRESIEQASALLTNYYLTHPLTLTGFNHQVESLIDKLSAAAFAAPPGEFPQYTLFVDEGEVVAEPSGSPRHRYGVYCELSKPLTESALQETVRKWLNRGEAHERYLSMNVCRYNC